MALLEHLYNTFNTNASRNFLCDDEEYYTYAQLLESIGKIRHYIRTNIPESQITPDNLIFI